MRMKPYVSVNIYRSLVGNLAAGERNGKLCLCFNVTLTLTNYHAPDGCNSDATAAAATQPFIAITHLHARQ